MKVSDLELENNAQILRNLNGFISSMNDEILTVGGNQMIKWASLDGPFLSPHSMKGTMCLCVERGRGI